MSTFVVCVRQVSKQLRTAWSQDFCHIHFYFLKTSMDFPGGAVVKNPPANAGDTGSSPGLGRSHMPRSN